MASSMKAQARWRGGAAAGVAVALLVAALVWERPAEAGGPLLVGGTFGNDSEPFVWDTATPVAYNTDQGMLGSLSTAEADGLVRDAFDVWQDVPTASISFSRAGDLGMNVDGSNAMSFFDSLGCSQTFTNAIVYDSDGGVVDAIMGEQQSEEVIGFASPTCLGSSPSNRITHGVAVLNGRFIDGQSAPSDLSENKFREVFVHEFGHLLGLDHSQANNEALDPALRTTDRLFGLPLMFPVLFGSTPARVDQPGFPPLAPDDEAWVSSLYPETTNNPPTQVPLADQFGRIEGNVFFSDGVTPLQGSNLVARLEDDLLTTQDESLRFAYSATSGFLFTGNPGQSVTGTNTGGSSFGSRDPTLIGFFQIPLKAGNYTVEVEAIDPDWIEGSSVGSLGSTDGAAEQYPLPGPREFWDTGESNADDPTASSLIPVTAGSTTPPIDIILNGTPPRFDSFESARLGWREPAPAWLRDRRPPAFLVTG